MVDQRKMLLDFATGKAAIYTVDSANTADEAPMNDPLSHLDRLAFHSDLDYLEIVHQEAVSFEFPSRTSGVWAYFTHTPFADHSLGVIPGTIFRVDGDLWSSGKRLQAGGDTRGRGLYLDVDTTGVTLYELCNSYGGTLAAITVDLEITLMAAVAPDAGQPVIDINPTAGYVQLGRTRLDTRRRYVRIGSPALMSVLGGRSHDASIDGATVGLREWDTDGAYVDVGTYTGSFPTPATYGLVK